MQEIRQLIMWRRAITGQAASVIMLLEILHLFAVPTGAVSVGEGPVKTHLSGAAFEEMLLQPQEPQLSFYEQSLLKHENHNASRGQHEPWWKVYKDEEERASLYRGGNSSSGSDGARKLLTATTIFPILRQGLVAPSLLTPSTKIADVNASLSSFDSVAVPTSVDWRSTSAMTTVKNQFQCGSCWAVATGDLLSIAVALKKGYGSLPPPPLNANGTVPSTITNLDLSIQQICDCTDNSNSCCKGGWPEWALQYILYNNGITNATTYPYFARNEACASVATANLTAKITSWELIRPLSVIAVKRAIAQAGPVLAYISAASNDFQTYSGGIYKGNCTQDLSHVVLIVGYGTDAVAGPYWILKNSWGTAWGENGYMRLAMVDGAGMCGITSAPAISLVPSFTTPVITDEFSSACTGLYPPPCGAGTCYSEMYTVSSFSGALIINTRARCSCPAGYVENRSGGPKCVSANPCGSNPNPCSSGTCTNNPDGTYSCTCGTNAVVGVQADGSLTCVAGSISSTMTFQLRTTDTCASVASTFNITVSMLQALNLGIDCAHLVVGAKIIVSNSTSQGCSSVIIVQKNQTCQSIASAYLTQVATIQMLNPGLDCTKLLVGQSVCVAPGSVSTAVTSVPPCGLTYEVGLLQDCSTIQATFLLDRNALLLLNPGLDCTATPLPNSLTLCVANSSSALATRAPVNCTKWYLVQHGDKCTSIWLGAGLTASQFFLLNPGLRCGKPYFQVGLNVCVAGPQTLTNFTNFVPYTVASGDSIFSISSAFGQRCGSSATPASICSQNALTNCSSPLVVGQALQVPCQWPIGRSCGCAVSQWVCGADGNWYSSYCDAVCNYATPATASGCSSCQYGCSGRCGFSQYPAAGTPTWCQSPCPYPPWPPVNWDWFSPSPCAFYVEACSSCCMGSWGYGSTNYWNCLAYCKQFKC